MRILSAFTVFWFITSWNRTRGLPEIRPLFAYRQVFPQIFREILSPPSVPVTKLPDALMQGAMPFNRASNRDEVYGA
jgi:hypothetical protein